MIRFFIEIKTKQYGWLTLLVCKKLCHAKRELKFYKKCGNNKLKIVKRTI